MDTTSTPEAAHLRIPCTVGMLAWNSGETLARTLENVCDFAEVIIADGGSTDNTLAIAGKYGARVIPQTNPGHAITDFSKERNLLLDAATQPWFLWLDSDELITDELREEIRRVTMEVSPSPGTTGEASRLFAHPPLPRGGVGVGWQGPPHLAYNIRIERCDPVTFEPFIDLRPNYQMRFFSTSIGGRYVNAVHEHVAFDRTKYSVGVLKGAWLVPLKRLKFASYKAEVDKRFPLLVRSKPPHTLGAYLMKGLVRPLIASVKILLRVLILRVLHPFGNVIPFVIERGRLYTQWVIMRESWKTYRSLAVERR